MSESESKEVFSRNLNYYMKKFKKDRNKLAHDLNINYSTIRDWTNGRAYPRIDKIELLAKYFDINKADLIENNDILLVEANSDAVLFKHIRSFSKNEIEEELLLKCTMLDFENQKKVLEITNMYLKEQGDFLTKDQNNKWIVIDSDNDKEKYNEILKDIKDRINK